jgi:MraZ protein
VAQSGGEWGSLPTLIGRFEHALDDKGRLTLPARFRSLFTPCGYLGEHDDGCLALWTPTAFQKQAEDRIERERTGGPEERNALRRWAGSIQEVVVDRQGRIQIPQALREFAGLSGEVLVVGVVNRVEIWSKERWRQMAER